MKKLLSIFLFSSCIFCNYEYSLEDYNTTSPTYGDNVWEPEYLNYITMHYFATQGWAGWTATFGQLSNFQEELRNDDGYENIVIIAVGQTNISAFNNNFCANSDLPLVMDLYPSLPIRDQFSPYGLDHYLVILDYDGNYIDHMDVTSLGNSEKSHIRSILEQYYQQSLMGDVNGDSVINVQDIVLTINLVMIGGYNSAADLNSDNIVNVLDIVQIVNIILNWWKKL